MGKIDGKNVIVTGSSRGIGADIARLFAAEGGNVICAARTLREGDHPLEGSLEKTVSDIREDGGEATASTVNISLEEDCVRLFDETHDVYGDVDILVNNAALTYFVPVKDYVIRRWKRSALVDMLKNRSGSIVNISSGAAIGPGRGPYPEAPSNSGGTCYGAEKAALERFTQGLAQEVYSEGVVVNCVSPSQVVPTPGTLFHNLVTGMDDPRGEHPELMAKAALLLATEPIDKVTGRVTYSQQILAEFGLLDNPRGTGVDSDRPGSGYSLL